MSGKRRLAILAAAGVLSVTTAASAVAASVPSSASPAKSVSQTATSAQTDAMTDAMTSSIGATSLNLEKARAAAVQAARTAQEQSAARARAIYLNRQAEAKAATAERAHAIYLNRLAQQQAQEQAQQQRQAAQQQAAQQQQQATAAASTSSQSSSSSSTGSSSSGSASYSGSPQEIAQEMLGSYGWSGQFSCLDSLWQKESDWSVSADNPGSGAYGIPQALPGSKMASAGSDWQTDAATQITWGLQYIQSTYGSPCAAWSHEEADGWY